MQATLCPYCMKMVQEQVCPHCGNNINYPGNPLHLPVGYTLNGSHPYVLGVCKGQGGFGITYIALDIQTNTRVAIKEYFPTYCSGRNAGTSVQSYYGQEDAYNKGKEHFLEEARLLQSLADLDRIVGVLDYFEANNTAYLVMEFVDGCSLKEYVTSNGSFPANQLLKQMKPLMQDVDQMHQRGLIHRDIAPDNIMLQPDGQLKLIDFGAARSYLSDKSMSVVVKKGFAPVEQYMRTGMNASTDVYALAASIYYCITGIVPPDSAERMYSNAPLQSPISLGADLTEHQENVLNKALAVQPKARTQSFGELIRDLYQDSSVPPVPSGPIQVVYQTEEHTINKGSPVEITEFKLMLDHEQNVLYATAKFRNLAHEVIGSITVEFRCLDSANEILDHFEVELSADSAGWYDNFGQDVRVALPRSDAAAYFVFVKRVRYAGGREISCGDHEEIMPSPKSLKDYFGNDMDLVARYQKETSRRAAYQPVTGKYYWICCCGTHNLPDVAECPFCGVSLKHQMAVLDRNYLEQSVGGTGNGGGGVSGTDGGTDETVLKIILFAILGLLAVVMIAFIFFGIPRLFSMSAPGEITETLVRCALADGQRVLGASSISRIFL